MRNVARDSRNKSRRGVKGPAAGLILFANSEGPGMLIASNDAHRDDGHRGAARIAASLRLQLCIGV